jgi:membrane fusion protein, multidrug efflux system
MRLAICAVALLCLIALAPAGRAQQPTAVPVGTVPAELRPVAKTNDFVGRVEAIEKVEIRARVTGFLLDVLFKEGDVVKAGDVLYRIEPDSFQAAVQQAKGALLQAQASVPRSCSGQTPPPARCSMSEPRPKRVLRVKWLLRTPT